MVMVSMHVKIAKTNSMTHCHLRTTKMTATEQDRSQMESMRSKAIDYFKSYDNWQYATIETVVVWMFERGWNERNKKVMELQARINALERPRGTHFPCGIKGCAVCDPTFGL